MKVFYNPMSHSRPQRVSKKVTGSTTTKTEVNQCFYFRWKREEREMLMMMVRINMTAVRLKGNSRKRTTKTTGSCLAGVGNVFVAWHSHHRLLLVNCFD
jgi:hypothetical protein